MSFSNDVFAFDQRSRSRVGGEMSLRTYLGTLSVLVVSGLCLAAMIASVTYDMKPNFWWIIGYFAVALPGIFLSAGSKNWFVSLIGYLMVIAATGAITGPYVALYRLDSVFQVLLITIGVSAAIGVAGVVYPKSVEHCGGFFLVALFVLIFGDIARMVAISFGAAPVSLKFWDWIAALVFCGLIFYDMNRATRMSYTLDNAVDNAVALYLDIINLFVRLLSAMGRRK